MVRIAQIGNSSNSMDKLGVIQVIFLRNLASRVRVSIVFIKVTPYELSNCTNRK